MATISQENAYICSLLLLNMRKLTTLFVMGCCAAASAQAPAYHDYFEDKSLRIDYLFTGDAACQSIYLDELSALPHWAGRRHHLDQLPLEGNGELTVRDKQTQTVIYRTSFSSLFQEWLGEPEAQTTQRGFENTFLVPFPQRPATVTIELRDAHRKVTSSLTHEVDPDDILIHHRGHEQITPHRYLLKSGEPDTCIDVAILAEGYTVEEMDRFYQDAQAACDALFEHEPFRHLKNSFNIVAVGSPSADSGVSIPRNNEWKNTAVSSHFDTFYSDRYLTTRQVKSIHNWLAGIPYEHIIILANTDTYGGGGIYNSYTLTTTHHADFRPVVVHEFGHSFGGLADEYAYSDEPSSLYPYDVEPWEQNITTLVDFDSKWKDMVPEGTPCPTPAETDASTIFTKVGVYEGGGYSLKGIYRPVTECRMRINEAPGFCPVCQRALERLIRFYTQD